MALVAVEIEGRVNGPIVLNPDGTAVLNVLGRNILIDPNVAFVSPAQPGSVSTPTARLTLAQLADPTPFPGRAEAGFDGSVVIVKGHYDPATKEIFVRQPTPPAGPGKLPAPSIEIQPYETVLVGPCSKNVAGNFEVAGVPVHFLPDSGTNPRLPGLPPESENGFRIDLGTVQIGDECAVEGYYGNTGVFHAFRVQAPGKLLSNAPQISIERATAKQKKGKWQIEVRGSITKTHLPAGSPAQSVRVFQRTGAVSSSLKLVSVLLPPAGDAVKWQAEFDAATPPKTIFATYESAPGPVRPEASIEVEMIAK